MAHFQLKNTVISDRRLPLPGRVVVLGRSIDADVPLPHRSVSRRHALVEYGTSGYLISDLGSSNGTFVDERRLEPGERVEVRLGQTFRVGQISMMLSPDEVLEGETAAAAPAHAALAAAVASRPAPPPASRPRLESPKPPAANGQRKRARPAVAKRSAQRQAKANAMRWVGVAVTVLLLGLAGIFILKIAGQESAKRAEREAAAAEEEKKDTEPPKIEFRPLGETDD